MVSIKSVLAAQDLANPSRGFTYAIDGRSFSVRMVQTSQLTERNRLPTSAIGLRDTRNAATNGASPSEAGIVPDSSPYIQIRAMFERPTFRFIGGETLSSASGCWASLLSSFTFHDGDFLGRQAVQVIHQPVNLRVRRVNLALENRLLRFRLRGSKLLV